MYNKQMTAWLVEQGVTEYTITEGTSSFNSLMWLLKLIKDISYYKHVKDNVNSRGSLEFDKKK